MKVVARSKIGSNWKRITKSALFERDVKPSRHSRLRMKLLVFENNRTLREFWKEIRPNHGPGGGLCKDTAGAVNSLATEWRTSTKDGVERAHLEVDARYFAVMGLLKTHLGTEVVIHECAHAAIAYCNRVQGRFEWEGGLPEERWCYPLGRIARAVIKALYEGGFYN